jgi:methylenetetrahydrofolate reductase (NADPH)
MEQFKRWLDMIRKAGVTMPIDVGVIPITDQAATITMAYNRNASVIPKELSRLLTKHWIFPNPYNPTEPEDVVKAKKAAFKEEGMLYTIRQIDQYRALGCNGIHMYVLNKSDGVARLVNESGMMDYI